jgi:hypothetical protein
MNGDIPAFPLCVFMTWTGKALPLPLLYFIGRLHKRDKHSTQRGKHSTQIEKHTKHNGNTVHKDTKTVQK